MTDLGASWIANGISLVVATAAVVALLLGSVANRKQVRLQTFLEYTRRYQEIMLHLPEGINRRAFRLNRLPKAVRDATLRYMRAYYDLCSEEFALNKMGQIHPEFWALWEEGIGQTASMPAFQQAWSIIVEDTIYDEEFSSFVARSAK
jgi:hypothetical protein